ncbi:MAG: hypothetical protein RSP_24950 [Rhodanobacter sp.]
MKIIKDKSVAGHLISLVIVACFLIAHQAYVTRANPDAPFMDTLRLVYQLEQWLSGRMSFWEYWRQGQHLGFIFQLILLGNTKFFSLDIILANRATGVVVALLALILLSNFVSTVREERKTLADLVFQTAILILIAAICFGRAGFELFTNDLGFALWVKNLLFVIYFSAYSWYLRAVLNRRVAWIAGLGLISAGPVIVLFVAMGWSYAFVAAVMVASAIEMIGLFKQGGWRRSAAKFLPLIALLIAQAVYVVASLVGFGGSPASAKSAALIHIPGLVFYALGSVVVDQDVMHSYFTTFPALPKLIGASMFVAAVVLTLSRFRRNALGAYSVLPFYLMAYGFFTAFSVSVARGHDGPGAVMASRYYMDIMLFGVGLIWLWFENLIRANVRESKGTLTGFIVLCFVVGAGQYLNYKQEWRIAPYRALTFKAMNEALLNGVPDQAAANLLQSPLDNARRGDQVMRNHGFSLYSKLKSEECRNDGVKLLKGWYLSEGDSTWMEGHARMLIPACHCDLVAQVYLPANFPARTLRVQDSASNAEIRLLPGQSEQVPFGVSKNERVVDLSVSATTVPAAVMSASSDRRHLGVLLTGYSYVCERDGGRRL